MNDILDDIVCNTRSTKQVIVHLEDGSAMVRLSATSHAVDGLTRHIETLVASIIARVTPSNVLQFRKIGGEQ